MATCAVKGRPGCKVVCSGKCFAYYPEPLGPCTAGCIPPDPTQTKIAVAAKFSVCIRGMTGSDVFAVFDLATDEATRGRLLSSSRIFDMNLQTITGQQFVQALLRAERGQEPLEV
jgi:hypothetical protein